MRGAGRMLWCGRSCSSRGAVDRQLSPLSLPSRGSAVIYMCVLLGALIADSAAAFGQLSWCWSFAGSGVSARGSFVTEKNADGEGFYRITKIAGRANSASVTALQATGTSVPGNAGYPVDNLVRQTAPQLTKHGFGFLAADGAYHNPFYLQEYRDYISRRPYPDGKGAEPTIQFKAVTAAAGAGCPVD